VCFTLACVLLAANAHWGNYGFVTGAEVSASASLALGPVSLALGTAYIAKSRPEMRRLLVFAFLISLLVLGAHLYVINDPPAETPARPLSGMVGTSFADSKVTVSSSLSGGMLSVNVTDLSGGTAQNPGWAVSSVTLSYGGEALPASGFTDPPTELNPLQPPRAVAYGFRDQVLGNWAMPSAVPENLTVNYQVLSCYHVAGNPSSYPDQAELGCIMDESYYVPSAAGEQVSGVYYPGLLQGVQCSTTSPNCNMEHPFLAKAIIAAGVAIFGLSAFGWRIFVAIMGSISVALLFVLVLLVSGNRRLACFGAILFALDTLFFVHSSAALIDVPALFFALLGFVFYFWRTSFWKVDHIVASGIFFGLSLLCKETSLFLLGAMVTYELVSGRRKLVRSAWRSLGILIPAVLVFFAGTQVYDSLFASGSYPYFYQQIGYMLTYGSSLRGGGWFDATLNMFITPLNWLTFYSPVPYLVSTVSGRAGNAVYSYVGVGYYGTTNSIIVWMVFAWLPLAAYRLLKKRTPRGEAKDDGLALFLIVWFVWAYLPYVLLWLYGRVTYPFYIIQAVPALAAGAAYITTRKWFPHRYALLYIAFAFVLFFIYFPVKDFLPVVIRSAIGR
jgi:predicted membrane-bound dolichyl-phosphate-mannose-protein mannosyltransferase